MKVIINLKYMKFKIEKVIQVNIYDRNIEKFILVKFIPFLKYIYKFI